MQMFTSADLQRRTGDVQASATEAPVAITDYGKPRNVMLSVTEFARLKRAAGEGVPEELAARRRAFVRHVPDPLGYDVRDLGTAARQMADDALSGRTGEAVSAELAAVRARFGGVRS
ncbi:hypothetical protein A3862_29900 (plasmid) [Methylobacterium sp. XJLW]|uniref:type II toxin-antitoxin system Phd/YefM family antitoxin n=1 Tax=Methylobacterium sp. XJLW TaxID=739141 RepID=UPI000DAB01CE|nr:type II toxin-antitoxin system Phd/YefM family antitoxin [Methylobacterium sp. XJLW]AWV19851.1 hypothetical protein A3862_29900 [Methylobacterium sp. XJLW]